MNKNFFLKVSRIDSTIFRVWSLSPSHRTDGGGGASMLSPIHQLYTVCSYMYHLPGNVKHIREK